MAKHSKDGDANPQFLHFSNMGTLHPCPYQVSCLKIGQSDQFILAPRKMSSGVFKIEMLSHKSSAATKESIFLCHLVLQQRIFYNMFQKKQMCAKKTRAKTFSLQFYFG